MRTNSKSFFITEARGGEEPQDGDTSPYGASCIGTYGGNYSALCR
jgi:hypothetical protein